MEILTNKVEVVERRILTIQDENKVYYYTEFFNSEGQCIDFTLTDKYGSIDDPIIYDSIQQFLAEQGI